MLALVVAIEKNQNLSHQGVNKAGTPYGCWHCDSEKKKATVIISDTTRPEWIVDLKLSSGHIVTFSDLQQKIHEIQKSDADMLVKLTNPTDSEMPYQMSFRYIGEGNANSFIIDNVGRATNSDSLKCSRFGE